MTRDEWWLRDGALIGGHGACLGPALRAGGESHARVPTGSGRRYAQCNVLVCKICCRAVRPITDLAHDVPVPRFASLAAAAHMPAHALSLSAPGGAEARALAGMT